MTDLRLATITAAGVIIAAYHIAGRTAEEARTAVIEWLDTRKEKELTVGDLWGLTEDW